MDTLGLPPLVLSEVCRLCLVRGMDMMSIFGHGESFADKILDIVQLEVTEADEWPSRICAQCAAQLNAAYNFRECCLIANTILSDHIGKPWLDEDTAGQECAERIHEAEEDSNDSRNTCHIKVEPDIILSDVDEEGSFVADIDPGSDASPPRLDGQPRPEGEGEGEKGRAGEREHCECGDLDCFSSDGECTFCGKLKFVGRVCLACNRTFKTKKSLVCHLRSHVNSSLYSCFYCDATFDSINRMTTHAKTHDWQGYGCKICSTHFGTETALLEHAETHALRSPGARPTAYLEALRRTAGDDGAAAQRCGHCFEAFASAYELSRHCARCPERTVRGNVSGAAAMPEGKRTAVHTCQTCGKGFHHLSRLAQHKKTHDAGKLYPCVFCAKSFSSQSFLAAHIVSHSGMKRKEHSRKVVYYSGEIE